MVPETPATVAHACMQPPGDSTHRAETENQWCVCVCGKSYSHPASIAAAAAAAADDDDDVAAAAKT